jgi:hypothetical protein
VTSHQLFVVTVDLPASGNCSDLLSMGSVLHRRGVAVVEAEFGGSRPRHFSDSTRPGPARTRLVGEGAPKTCPSLGATSSALGSIDPIRRLR